MEGEKESEVWEKLYELRGKLVETGSLDGSEVNAVRRLLLTANFEYLLALRDEKEKNKWLASIKTAQGIIKDVALQTYDSVSERKV